MVDQKNLQNHQIRIYQTYIKFFQSTLDIKRPIRENIPHSEILDEINYAISIGCSEIGKAIIAKHALLSFLPVQLRDNKLIQIYVFKKLLK